MVQITGRVILNSELGLIYWGREECIYKDNIIVNHERGHDFYLILI